MVEKKEHQVSDLSAGDVLEIVDSEGNALIPSKPTDYRIVDEDGSTLKEGTLKDTNTIHLTGITTRRFRVFLDSYIVTDSKGYEPPEREDVKIEESDTTVPEASGIDSESDLLTSTKEPEDESEPTPEEQEESENPEASETNEAEQESSEEESVEESDRKSVV